MTKSLDKSKVVRKLRCAVYTRKSSEEGLEQEFNSLHAQREACEAYIASQRSEGWVLVRDQYDDGGISGGTLERPGLKRLMADIEDGLVDVVVVYKIDRLSRSLALWTVHAVHRTQANVVSRRETLFLANQQVTGIFMPADLWGSTTPKTGMTVADIPMDRCLPETLSCLITSFPIQKSCSIDTEEVRA